MRGAIAALIVVISILIGLGLKAILVSTPPANSQTSGANLVGVPVHDLHLNHPDMENLPRQEAPSP
jgi:hypothetical protein